MIEYYGCLICGVPVREAKEQKCAAELTRLGIEFTPEILAHDPDHFWVVMREIDWDGLF